MIENLKKDLEVLNKKLSETTNIKKMLELGRAIATIEEKIKSLTVFCLFVKYQNKFVLNSVFKTRSAAWEYAEFLKENNVTDDFFIQEEEILK